MTNPFELTATDAIKLIGNNKLNKKSPPCGRTLVCGGLTPQAVELQYEFRTNLLS